VPRLRLGSRRGGFQRVLSLGEAKWGEVMGRHHLQRLARARDLLAASTAGDTHVSLIGFDRIYQLT
jgi:hypothetical protein